MRNRLIVSVTIALLLLSSSAWSAPPGGKHGAAKAKLLTSRRAVTAALGEGVAAQIPVAFNFDLFALAWLDLPVDPEPAVEIITLPADRAFRLSHSSSLVVEVVRRTRALEFTVTSLGSPCSGGSRKPPEHIAECQQQANASAADARKILRLFATPRHRLARTRVRVSKAPARP